jgi:hypothetical protein
MLSIFDIQENKVTTNLNQYPIILMSESGDGKTTTMNKILTEIAPEGKKPLFIMFEDRYQHIVGIKAIRIHNMGELMTIKSQLLLPQAKDLFSCVVFDTVDRMDSLIEKFVSDSKGVQITGDLGFGKGNKYVKSSAQFIFELKNAGWTTHFITQSHKNTDITTSITTYEPKVNKEIWNIIYQDAYLAGFLKVKPNGERVVTFQKTNEQPKLKDSIGMPKEVKIEKFKETLIKSIESMAGGALTDEDTISKEIKDDRDFEQIKARGVELGGELTQAGFLNEAMFILAQNIGTDEAGNPKMFDTLIPAQIDVAEIVVQKLEALKKEKGLA